MPRKAALPPLSEQQAAAGGVAAVDRALSLLDAFTAETPVFGAAGELLGAVTLTMPTPRLQSAHAADVKCAERKITEQVGGVCPAPA